MSCTPRQLVRCWALVPDMLAAFNPPMVPQPWGVTGSQLFHSPDQECEEQDEQEPEKLASFGLEPHQPGGRAIGELDTGGSTACRNNAGCGQASVAARHATGGSPSPRQLLQPIDEQAIAHGNGESR